MRQISFLRPIPDRDSSNGWASGYLYPGATYPFGMVQFTPTYFTKQLGFVINQLSGCGMRSYGKFPYASGCGSLYGFLRN